MAKARLLMAELSLVLVAGCLRCWSLFPPYCACPTGAFCESLERLIGGEELPFGPPVRPGSSGEHARLERRSPTASLRAPPFC